MHLSDLYNAYYQEAEPNRYKGDTLDRVRAGLGLAFEEKVGQVMEPLIGADSGRPGELIIPGLSTPVAYSPDFILFEDRTILGEVKLTWMSSREWPRERTNGFPKGANKYLTQIACQCRAMETPYATLIAYFVNGDNDRKHYDTGMAPKLLRWDIEFSKREMDEEWQTVLNHAKRRKLL